MSFDIQSIGQSVGVMYKKPKIDEIIMFHKHLNDSQEAKDFLMIQRNLSDETIKYFHLGYDAYRNQIVIPEEKNKEFVNIAYRSLEQQAKIKYVKERGCENWIFHEKGIEHSKKKGNVLVTSNQFDVMSAYQAGIEAVVSVPVGKDSTGIWMELFDNIPKVYICFDKTSKTKALEFAERVGTDKCYEIQLPEDVNDLNDYFKRYDKNHFIELVKQAKPYYKYKYKGLGDVINLLKEKKENTYKFKCIPYVEFEEDWIAIISGVSNAGKTTHVLNLADELANKNISTLILPFERGIKTVGKRYLQVRFSKTQTELEGLENKELDEMIENVSELPLYFSVPTRDQIRETIARAKKIFNTKVVIVDHLDYLVRKSGENHNVETSNTLQEFKALAQEFNILFLIVHHIKKQEGVGSSPKKPKMEDLKGSSSTYQDPEAVVMLSSPEIGQLEVDIVKNKGEMGSKIYFFNTRTGRIGDSIDVMNNEPTEKQLVLDSYNKF